MKRLGQPLETSNGQLRFNSPFTPPGKNRDTKNHLYVNLRSKKWFCFRTSRGGPLFTLFAALGEVYTEDPDFAVASFQDMKDRATSLTTETPFEVPRVPLPPDYRPMSYGSRVYEYLKYRDLTDNDIVFYQIGEGTKEYSGWAIIPSFDKTGRCEYWVARNSDPGDERRYDNPTAARRYHVMFINTAVEQGNGSIIICEGVFSAIAAGRSACATMGKHVTENQISVIRDSGAKIARVCLDADAWEDSIKLAARLLRIGLIVTVIRMPSDQKDPSVMGRDNFFNHLSRNEIVVTESTLSHIRLREVIR